MSLRVLFLASEVAPFAKSGGLADVTGSLPKALAAVGHDVLVIMPAHRAVESASSTARWGLRATGPSLQVPILGGTRAGVLETVLPDSSVPIRFIAERTLFDRPEMYGYDDDPYRFGFFSRAALQLAVEIMDWRPDVVHAHDWHAAPALLWLATAGQQDRGYRSVPTVFTIHNLLHQGRTSTDILRYLGVTTSQTLYEEGPGEVNLMGRAIYYATMITTVSPTYAREILTASGGAGLDGLLRHRHFDVHGILNGLDYDVWDPAGDSHLQMSFEATTLERRLENKRALQARVGLVQRDDVPIIAMVSRLDGQKGLDLVGPAFDRLLQEGSESAQVVVLGSGAAQYEVTFRRMAERYPGAMAAVLGYDPALAPLIYAGADLFAMPSRFEPCGLGQLIAMRYGCVPVVRATGGLADTVQDGITGFAFAGYDVDEFLSALRRALAVFRTDPGEWRAIQQRGMSADFSWAASARGYDQVYQWAISRVRGW
jgi:starch synthase